jgi:trypsin
VPAVVGGEEAAINSIPWQVGVEVYDQFPYCGGTLIGPSTVLTASHCVEGIESPSQINILIGEHNLLTGSESVSK